MDRTFSTQTSVITARRAHLSRRIASKAFHAELSTSRLATPLSPQKGIGEVSRASLAAESVTGRRVHIEGRKAFSDQLIQNCIACVTVRKACGF
jgi:hypothetical protein